MSRGKLHELLAVEPDLRGAAEKILNEHAATFTKKHGLFLGQVRTYQPADDQGEELPEEIQHLNTTVEEEMEYVRKIVARYWDAVAQKETANTEAKADIVVEDEIFLKNVPATLLLALEGKLKQLRECYQQLPTLPPTDDWKFDTDVGHFKTRPITTKRTKKIMKNHVLANATDKHPAQVQVYTEDETVGHWQTVKHCGMLPPIRKAAILERIDNLQRAVKQARRRANSCEVKPVEVADKLFSYIHGKE